MSACAPTILCTRPGFELAEGGAQDGENLALEERERVVEEGFQVRASGTLCLYRERSYTTPKMTSG